MHGFRIRKRLTTVHLDYGYMAIIVGTCAADGLTWYTAYLWLPYPAELIRELDATLGVAERFNISFIGAGQQHWLIRSVQQGINESKGGDECWLGWDWMSEAVTDGKPKEPDLHACLVNATAAYGFIMSELESQRARDTGTAESPTGDKDV